MSGGAYRRTLRAGPLASRTLTAKPKRVPLDPAKCAQLGKSSLGTPLALRADMPDSRMFSAHTVVPLAAWIAAASLTSLAAANPAGGARGDGAVTAGVGAPAAPPVAAAHHRAPPLASPRA